MANPRKQLPDPKPGYGGSEFKSELDFIMQVESEGFDPEDPDQSQAMDEMIRRGTCWHLQGFWGRTAHAYLEWKRSQNAPD